jgi:ABC-2 type transport system permease protein
MVSYRAATLAGLVTNFFFGAMRAYIFIALYRGAGKTVVAGYSIEDAVTYTALTQAAIAPLLLFGWWDVMRTIQSGDIASDLTKPIDYYSFWLARDLGRALHDVLARGVPILLAYSLVFDIVWPGSAAAWAGFGVSALLALLISFSWRFVVNVSAFWSTDAFGLGRVAYMSVLLLSGFLVPVAFFPDWLQGLVRLLPFPAMVNTPIELWLGMLTGRELAAALLVQTAWVVGLAALARFAYGRGVARLAVQGG